MEQAVLCRYSIKWGILATSYIAHFFVKAFIVSHNFIEEDNVKKIHDYC